MYVPKSLKLTEHDVKNLMCGGSVKLTKSHLSGGSRFNVTKTQANRIDNVHHGRQGHTRLKLTDSHIKHEVKNNSMWRKIWNAMKSGADYVTPYVAPVAKHGSEMLMKQAANTLAKEFDSRIEPGVHLTAGLSHLKKGKGNRIYNSAAFNNGPNEHWDNAIYNHEVNNTLSKRRRSSRMGHYNHPAYNTVNRLAHMGFNKEQILDMAGSGVMKSIWKGTRKTGEIIYPIVAEYLAKYAMKKLLGGSQGKGLKPIKFNARQYKYAMGLKTLGSSKGGSFGSFFTDSIPSFFSKPSNALGAAAFGARFVPVPGLAPALTAASIGTRMAGRGTRKKRRSSRKSTRKSTTRKRSRKASRKGTKRRKSKGHQ